MNDALSKSSSYKDMGSNGIPFHRLLLRCGLSGSLDSFILSPVSMIRNHFRELFCTSDHFHYSLQKRYIHFCYLSTIAFQKRNAVIHIFTFSKHHTRIKREGPPFSAGTSPIQLWYFHHSHFNIQTFNCCTDSVPVSL